MVSGLQAVSQSRRQFGRFLLLQNLHFRPPWRSRHASACRKLATQSAEQPVGPEGRALKRTVAALHSLPRARAVAYTDVGEGRELGAEALPAKCVLHLYASDHAETVCHYSEVP